MEVLEERSLPSVSLNLMEYHDPSRIPAGLKPSAFGILPQNNGFTTPVGYTPDQLRTAYGIDSITFGGVTGDGTGQTIAIVDAYDDPAFVDSTSSTFASSDLAQFDAILGIADPPSFTKVNQLGQPSPLPKTDPAGAGNASGNWEIEEALDVEWAHAMAPGANIILVEANSASNSDLFAAVAEAASLPGVSAVSMSWGVDEFSGETAQDSTFVTPSGHQGVTFVAASGDNGGFNYDAQGNPTTTPGILYPAASPNVLAAGGTTLQLNADNTIASETAWSGSGGGTSQYEPEPAYQQNVQSTGFRTIPDVAFDADPNTGVAVYDSYDNTDNSGPWVDVGGTSVSAPAWAGLIAIANQGRVLVGGGTLDGPSQTMQALYAFPPIDFHDITSGNNGVFNAGVGYDEVTGLGSPDAPNLMAGLTTYGTASQIAFVAQPPSSVIAGDSFGVVVAAEDSAGSVDPAFNGTLTISLAANPTSATLGGTLTATAVDGVAVFDGLTLDQLGNGYTLQVASTKFSSITSNSFDIIANPTPWQGTFYPVPTDASLRSAIAAADSNAFAFNTILLSSSTYTLTDISAGAITIQNTSSLPDKTLTILGQGASNSIIGSTYSWKDRLFSIVGSGGPSLTVVVQSLTLEGGNAEGGGILGGTAALGGALLVDDANVTLANDTLQNNQAQGVNGAAGKAGALGAKGAGGGNGDNAMGGAIYLANGTLSLFGDTLESNSARGGVGGIGGAGGGQGTKSAAAVAAGTGGMGGQGGSASGGAIYAASGTVLLDHDTVRSNQAIGGAGGTGGTGGSGGHGKAHVVAGVPGGVGGAGGQGGSASGGGIFIAGGSITLTGSTLETNSAHGGAGGVGGHGGAGTLEAGSSLTGLFGGGGSSLLLLGGFGTGAGGIGGNGGSGGRGGSASGGGIYIAAGSLTVFSSTFSGNQAIGAAGGAGGQGGTGGFGSATAATILGLGLPVGKTGGSGGVGGLAGFADGGGILVAGGKIEIYGSTLNGNEAEGGQGGTGGVGGYGPLAVLAGGTATLGTGGFGTGLPPTTLGLGGPVANTAGPGGDGGDGGIASGGGIYVSGGSLALINGTVAANSALAGASGSGGAGGKAGSGTLTGGVGAAGAPGSSSGGGMYINGGTVNLNNSTIALNTQKGAGSGGGVVESAGTVTAVSTIFGDNGTVDYSGSITSTDSLFQTAPTGTLSGSGNLTGVDPLLSTSGLQNNGGATETIALQALSPAIGAGENPDNLFADQRGYELDIVTGGIDIGAYQTNAQADSQAPSATLQAGGVTSNNAAALNPYTFSITYSDNVAVAAPTLNNAVVTVTPPGQGAPIATTVVSMAAVGTADVIGDAASYVVTYEFTPPGGSWTTADNGNYTISLNGGEVTDLAGNPVAAGSLGTFAVDVGQTTSPPPGPPSAAISGPTDGYSGVAGEARSYTLSATDPLQSQQAAGFSYTVNWGDGQTDTYGPGDASPDTESHVYSKPGTYTITLTAADQAGLASAPVTTTATILQYEMQGNTLAVGGTPGNDSFVFSAGTTAGSLISKLNGTTLGTFQALDAAVYGDGGTDGVTINGVQSSANTFTLNGSTATFTAVSLGSNVFTVGLNNVGSVTFAGGSKGNSFTNTAATVASVLHGKLGGPNTFTFAGTDMGAPATIVSGGANNTLYGPNEANVWNVTGVNSGNLNGTNWTFSGIQNLVGGTQTNDFIFSSAATIGGSLNGGGGGTLDESHYATAVRVNLQTSATTVIKGKFSNVTAVIGGSAVNTLIGANVSNAWNITGTDSGTVNGLAFTNFANLKGGTGSNDFVFSDGAAVKGTITGNTTGTNRLDYTAYTSGIYVNLVTKTATGTGGISGIQQVLGGSGNDVMVGAGAGILLQAGSGTDLIIGGGRSATIDGGSGQDLIIDGTTTYDSNATALKALEAYWSDTSIALSSRVSQLTGTGTPTGSYKLTHATVAHAAASDTVVLNSTDDWLFWRKTGTNADNVTGTPEQSTFI